MTPTTANWAPPRMSITTSTVGHPLGVLMPISERITKAMA
jgi:hypothetical protein